MVDFRILVTAANGDIAEAAARILRSGFPGSRIDGADALGDLPGRLRFDRIFPIPWASAPDYIECLSRLVHEQCYDIVLVASEPEVIRLSAERDGAASLPLLINAPGLVARFTDKIKTAEWFQAIGLRAPRTWRPSEVHDGLLPLFAKRRSGSGSRGTMVVTDSRVLPVAVELAQQDDMIFQDLLDDKCTETTSAMLRIGGDFRHVSFRRRLLGGMTSWAEVIQEPELDRALEQMALHIPDDDFFLNVQGRLTEHGPCFFEVNCRFSSTIMMRHLVGFSDLEWMLNWRLRQLKPKPYIKPPAGTQVFRLAREEVVPL